MREISNFPLTQDEQQILLGTLLGDGSFLRREGRKPIVRIMHTVKQKEYTDWKCGRLQRLTGIEKAHIWHSIKSFELNGRTYKPSYAWASTRAHTFILHLEQLLCQDNKKIVTRHYLNLLNPLGIAVWWMDDGQCQLSKHVRGWIHARRGYLWTSGFSKEENLIIIHWFRTVWGIDCRLKERMDKKINYYLFFNGENLRRLIQIIKPYIPECMNYKIDLKYQDPKSYNVEFLPTRTTIKTVESDIV